MGIMSDFYKKRKEEFEDEKEAQKIRKSLRGKLKWRTEEIIHYQKMKGKIFLRNQSM